MDCSRHQEWLIEQDFDLQVLFWEGFRQAANEQLDIAIPQLTELAGCAQRLRDMEDNARILTRETVDNGRISPAIVSRLGDPQFSSCRIS